MLAGIVPEIQFILNHDGQRSTIGTIQLDLENDSYYAVHSYIKTEMTAKALNDAYHSAFPILGAPAQVVRGALMETSRLLQQEHWPYCGEQPRCRRPNAYNRADLAINYVECLSSLPEAFMGWKLFSIPLMIFEVEGSKDKWGRMEQQAKAMREVCCSLAVMPECYLVFIYPALIEIWKAERNVAKCCIDITAEQIHLNEVDRSLRGALEYFLDRVFEILIRQTYHSLPITEYTILSLRNVRQVQATGHTRSLWAGRCCDECYVLEKTRTAASLRAAYPRMDIDWEGEGDEMPDDEDEDM